MIGISQSIIFLHKSEYNPVTICNIVKYFNLSQWLHLLLPTNCEEHQNNENK